MYRRALLPLAIGQFLAPALPALTGVGQTVGERARTDYGGLPPEQPIGLAFSIWGVIFSAYLIFALLALAKETELTRRVAKPLAIAGALNILWMLVAQFLDYELLNYALLWPVLWFCWRAAAAFETLRGMGGNADKFFADAATGLLAGWLTTAVAISLPLAIRALTGLGPSDAPWHMLLLTLGTACFGGVVFARRVSASPWFFTALGWGVFGVALNNWFRTEMTSMAVFTLAVGIWLILWRVSLDRNRTEPA